MFSFLAGLIAMAALGAVVAGVLNQWNLLGFHLAAWPVSASLAALYTLGWLLKARGGAASSNPALAWLSRLHGALVLLLGLALVAAIPAMWWGIIKRLASGAIKGG